jgi:hypothetical protein
LVTQIGGDNLITTGFQPTVMAILIISPPWGQNGGDEDSVVVR